jgi:pyrophosphatase PpaX
MSSPHAPRPPRPLALLFDLDGTLADSIALILGAFRYTFATHLGAAPPDDAWISGMGTPLASQLRGLVPDEALLAPMLATYREFQREHHDRLLREFDGARDTLALLHTRGHPTALVTSKSNDLAHRALAHLGLAPYIDHVVGLDSCQRHKPDPEPVHLALAALERKAAEAVFVGDSPHDMAAGNAAGVITIAALWGPFPRPALESATPSHLIHHIRELPPLLDRIANSSRDLAPSRSPAVPPGAGPPPP